MSNIYTQFKRLIPDAPLLVGIVTAYADGVATIELPDGGVITARGSASISDSVFVRDGVIEGTAPDLTAVEITV